jgi:hypothetical protein
MIRLGSIKLIVTIIVVFVIGYTGFAIGMEFWARTFNTPFLDLGKIEDYGYLHPSCNNLANLNATFIYYKNYDCKKYFGDIKLNCSEMCVDESGGKQIIADNPTQRITRFVYHKCIKIAIEKNVSDLVYFDKCYVNINKTALTSIIPPNEYIAWVSTYLIGTIVLVSVCCAMIGGIICYSDKLTRALEMKSVELKSLNMPVLYLNTLVNDHVETCSICGNHLCIGQVYFPIKCNHRHHATCLQEWITETTEKRCPDCSLSLLYIKNINDYQIAIV